MSLPVEEKFSAHRQKDLENAGLVAYLSGGEVFPCGAARAFRTSRTLEPILADARCHRQTNSSAALKSRSDKPEFVPHLACEIRLVQTTQTRRKVQRSLAAGSKACSENFLPAILKFTRIEQLKLKSLNPGTPNKADAFGSIFFGIGQRGHDVT